MYLIYHSYLSRYLWLYKMYCRWRLFLLYNFDEYLVTTYIVAVYVFLYVSSIQYTCTCIGTSEQWWTGSHSNVTVFLWKQNKNRWKTYASVCSNIYVYKDVSVRHFPPTIQGVFAHIYKPMIEQYILFWGMVWKGKSENLKDQFILKNY